MVPVEKKIRLTTERLDAPAANDESTGSSRTPVDSISGVRRNETKHLAATFLTTLSVFAIYFGQGILVARLLGPVGRGEFGTAVFFPRDVLLYVGLLGGIEIVTRRAADANLDANRLKYSAATLGLFSGVLTAFVSVVISVVALLFIDHGAKSYLIPYCLLISFFVPWEHIHLVVSGVDRGREQYRRYNINRLAFAASFPLIVGLCWVSGLLDSGSEGSLGWVCVLFVCSRVLGLLPTLTGLNFGVWLSDLVGAFSGKQSRQNALGDQPTARILLKDGWPYALSMFASELFERMDVILILVLASVEESGFYFVAIPAAALLTIAPNSLSVFTFNAGAENRLVSLKNAIGLMASTALFQLISMVILGYLIPLLIIFFYGEPFQPAIQFVLYLLPAFAIKGILQAFDGYLKGRNLPMIGVYARLMSILAMLVFVILFFGKYQLLSIPMAAFVGQLLSLIVVTYFLIQEVRNSSIVVPGGVTDV